MPTKSIIRENPDFYVDAIDELSLLIEAYSASPLTTEYLTVPSRVPIDCSTRTHHLIFYLYFKGILLLRNYTILI